MNKLTSSWLAALSGIILAWLSASAAWAERRVALIIGNSQYKDSSLVLFNPKNDAEDVAASLRTLGFEVIVKIDAGKRDFDLAMAQFARLATSADTALFYYAGHALQHQGQNYLMPTDAQLVDEISLRYQMVSLDDVRLGLAQARGVKIMILDACRNNPIVDRLRGRTDVTRNAETVRGLARIGIDGAEGEVVAYATAANQVAADGGGRNSPFTAALLNRLGEAGLEIGTMFRRIAADVYARTKGQQRPELLISLITEYYLNQSEQARPTPAPTIPPSLPSPPVPQEQICQRDLERLAHLRASPATRDEVIRFERELGCLSLRPQVERLSESVSAEGERDQPEGARKLEGAQRAEAEQLHSTADLGPQRPPRDGLGQVAPPPIPQEQICQRDQERLAHLRASPARDEVVRFRRELGCEGLRQQVERLLESISTEAERSDREATQRFQIEQRRLTADAEPQEPEGDAAARVAPAQDARVEDQPARQGRPRRRVAGRHGFRGDFAHSRRPDWQGPHFSFQPFMFFDANRHDANHR